MHGQNHIRLITTTNVILSVHSSQCYDTSYSLHIWLILKGWHRRAFRPLILFNCHNASCSVRGYHVIYRSVQHCATFGLISVAATTFIREDNSTDKITTAFGLSLLSCTYRSFRGPFDTELVYMTFPTYVCVFLDCCICIVLDQFADNTSVMLVPFCETSRLFG